MYRPLNPTALQGNLLKMNYFEGWFQKIYSHEHGISFLLIYGMATGHSSDKKGFLQLHIPHHEHVLLNFNERDISFSKDEHHVRMGENLFSLDRIYLKTADVQLNLYLKNAFLSKIGGNSMGRYYLIPNLPCYHAVMNESHEVSGEIYCSEKSYTINGAKGYLEKNWGTSFPEEYLWLHGFDPQNSDNQLLFSRANMKWMGRTYKKHVGYLKLNGMRIDLRQLRRSVIHIERLTQNEQRIRISNPNLTLEITITLSQEIHFQAPEKGMLQRSIAHHNDVSIHIRLSMGSFNHEVDMIGNYENMGF